MPQCGVLVVRDLFGHMPSKVPEVLEMNIIHKCYQELFGQYGSALLGEVSTLFPNAIVDALQKCHVASIRDTPKQPGRGRVWGKRACHIPGGTMKIVAATCSEQFSNWTVLFELPESGLPADPLASQALVHVSRGTAYIPIVNVGEVDVLLYSFTVIVTLDDVSVVSLLSGVARVSAFSAQVTAQDMSTPMLDQIDALDLLHFTI